MSGCKPVGWNRLQSPLHHARVVACSEIVDVMGLAQCHTTLKAATVEQAAMVNNSNTTMYQLQWHRRTNVMPLI
jgi:hypothetical protein